MRIGIDARYGFRRDRRGIGEYVASLIGELGSIARPSDEFHLYLDRDSASDAVTGLDGRFTLHELGARNPLFWEEVCLPAAAAHDHLDLLHLTANYGPSVPPCPTVYTIHDLIEFIRPGLGPMRLPLRHAVGRAIRTRTLPAQARRARLIITISEASAFDLTRLLHLPPTQLRVIPQGISGDFVPADNDREVRAHLRSLGYPVPDRYILALGAMDPRKNGPFLMQTFARVQSRHPDVALWIVGVETPERYPIPLEPVPEWLKVLGFVPREALVALLQGATGFVYPSLYEGFGLPILQAMACGVPVLSSNSTSMPEVVGSAGTLFDPTDSPSLERCLLTLLEDVTARTLWRVQGLRQVQRFSWTSTANQTYKVYEDAVGCGG